jgi:cytochrome c biogenesis protein CcdA
MSLLEVMEGLGTRGVPAVAAFFIGLMMAISPCPLATNLTAVAYITQRSEGGRHTLLVGSLYTLGRMAAYVGVAALIVLLGLEVQAISHFLQVYGERILGPLLIVIGIVMLGVVRLPVSPGSARYQAAKERVTERLAGRRYLGPFLLGLLFALSFCPFSAVLYFGMLIPLALRAQSPVVVPSVFAIATGLPVVVLSLLLVQGIATAGRAVRRVQGGRALGPPDRGCRLCSRRRLHDGRGLVSVRPPEPPKTHRTIGKPGPAP